MRKEYSLPNGWQFVVWYDVTRYDADEILDDLIGCGCSGDDLVKCERSLWGMRRNNGLTYSNPRLSRSVMVIGHAASKREAANTIAHEIGHLAVHIARARGIGYNSEAFCYLIGDVTRTMWDDSHRLTCERCGG